MSSGSIGCLQHGWHKLFLRTRPFALTAMLPVAIAEARPDERKQTETEIVRSSGMADSSTKEENDRVKGEVPQAILEAILKEVAALARVGPDQVAIARAESVV
jgi:hypothetical protein